MKAICIVMGSQSDLKVMQPAANLLNEFKVEFDLQILSAHRTPHEMLDFARTAHQHYKIIIAGAGGAAHLPGMLASSTHLPVIGVPINITALHGVDALYSIVQMPKGVPVACVGIDNSQNAALLAIRMLALNEVSLQTQLQGFQQSQKQMVAEHNQNLKNLSNT